MKRIVLVMALASFVAGCQSKGGGDGASSEGAAFQSTAPELMERYRQAMMGKDVAALERMWSHDFTFINPRGQLLNKSQRLENVRTGATSFKSINVSEEQHCTVGPDAAVTTCRVGIDGQYSGQEGSGDYRSTMVWGRRGGSWQIVALQMTRIGQ